MSLDADALAREITKEIVGEITNQVDKEFRQKANPKGKKWPITKKGHPFDPHDSIRASIDIKAKDNVIEISSTKPYTGFLNYGTERGIPAREIWPEDYFPRRWSAVEDKIDKIMESYLDGLEPKK